ADSAKHTILMDSVRDLERIGEHFENIIELIDYKIAKKVLITDEAQEDLTYMFELTTETVRQGVHSLDGIDSTEAQAVAEKEAEVDQLEKVNRKRQSARMNEGKCYGSAGIVFVDIISNLERIGDHAVNIAEDVIDEAA